MKALAVEASKRPLNGRNLVSVFGTRQSGENGMLDDDHPQSAHIFAASNQLDFVLKFAKNTTLGTGKFRRDCFQIAQPAFAALRWLNENQFGKSDEIASAINELESAFANLSELTHNPEKSDRTQCPACLKAASTFVAAQPYCSDCLDMIMPALQKLRSCETGFGTDAI